LKIKIQANTYLTPMELTVLSGALEDAVHGKSSIHFSAAGEICIGEKIKKGTKQIEGVQEMVNRVIEYLNKVTGRNFGKSRPGTFKNILARMKERHTLDDFKKVIDHKASEWLDNPDMRQYLRPSTLFSSKNFANYLDEAENPVKDPLAEALDEAFKLLED